MKELTLETIESDIKEAVKKVSRLEKSLQTARFELDALQHVYQRYSEPPAKRKPLVPGNLGIDPEVLVGVTLEDALVKIAGVNNGVLVSTPTRKLLEESGHLSESQSGKELYLFLKSSNRFEQISRGRYQLLEEQ